MTKRVLRLVLLLLPAACITRVSAQEQKAFYEKIPDAPATYEAGNVVARVLDGLGFRFYWATEALSEKDLAYRPSEGGRSTAETIGHIYGLTLTIRLAVEGKPAISDGSWMKWTVDKKRGEALENIRVTRGLVAGLTPEELGKIEMRFGTGDDAPAFPFWNLLNGPIADALYHTGQIVTFRRTSGNPMPEGVDVLMGVKQ